MKLYSYPLSGHAHRARLFLSLLDVKTEIIDVDLATRFGRRDWLPEEPRSVAKIQKWLSVAAGEIAYGPAAARLITVFGADYRADEVISRARHILGLINAELAPHPFITGETPTIADIALYSYLVSAPEGNVDMAPHRNIRHWLKRIEALPGFVPMPETAAGPAI